MKLVVDGRNSLYRAVFASLGKAAHKNYEFMFVKFMVSYIRKFKPTSINVMWDSRGGTWRKEVYPPYKDRGSHKKTIAEKYGIDVDEVVCSVESKVRGLFDLLGFTQYEKIMQEADDLIYSYCELYKDEDVVVVSSDGDMLQIPYFFSNIRVFNPIKDAIITRDDVKEYDPVVIKCLQGDKSDNIPGLRGIGPVKAKKMADDLNILKEYLMEGDGSRFEWFKKFRLIIDLAECPFLKENTNYIKEHSTVVNNFSLQEAYSYSTKNGLQRVTQELTPLRDLLNKCKA